MNAPSARNTKPWHFIVVRDRKMMDRIVEIAPNGSMIKSASAAILVIGDLKRTDEYYVIDCAAAVQNMLLAAHDQGLGACWVGVHPRQARKDGLKKLFQLPDGLEPHSLIAIGHPAENKQPNSNYMEDRVHMEKW